MSDSHPPDVAEDEQQPDEDATADDIQTMLDEQPPAAESADAGSVIDFIGNGGIKQLLLRETFQDPETGHQFSQAALVADVVNVMRMDVKQMCRLHGIDVEVEKMSPERAAELLESVAQNDGMGIIEVFQTIEEKRDHVFQQEMTEEQYEQYQAFKREMLYSVGDGA